MSTPTSNVLALRAFDRRATHPELSFLSQLLIETSLCHSRREVAELAAEMAREVFRGVASAAMLFDGSERVTVQAFSGIAWRNLTCTDMAACRADPVLGAVLDHQVAVHSGQLVTPDAAGSALMAEGFAQSVGVFHYLAAPLYGGTGKVVGLLGVCRRAAQHPFDGLDIRWVTALAGHLSVALARLPHPGAEGGASDFLTRREKQVAALVIQGANNVRIATSLQIARDTVKKTLQRMYEKLRVHGRAEMVARLLVGGVPRALDEAPDELR